MPLWGNADNAANSVISVVQQVNQPVSATNRTRLFNNVTANVIVQGQTVGQFGVSSAEQQVLVADGEAKGAHAGWNLRTVGQGGRAGRVFYETLVAMGSLSGDGSDDSILADVGIIIHYQPQSQSIPNNDAASFTVGAEGVPAGTTLTYKWQRNGSNITDAGVYTGSATDTLEISNVATLNANSYGVIVYAGAFTKLSDNAVLTVV